MKTNVRATSITAYHQLQIDGGWGTQAERIACALKGVGDAGLTLREIQKVTGMDINAVSGRVNGLKELGHVVECARRHCPVTGKYVTPVRLARG